jgi:hypothetical protein
LPLKSLIALTSWQSIMAFNSEVFLISFKQAVCGANSNRNKPIKQAVCDRGYVGAKIVSVQTSSCLKKPLSETIVINETKSANCAKDERRLSRLSDILNRLPATFSNSKHRQPLKH